MTVNTEQTTTAQLATTNIVDWNRAQTLWYLPITVMDLTTAGIETNAVFGIDDDERAALAHEPGIVRLTFGVDCDPDGCERVIDVEAYEVRMPDSQPHWYVASRRYSHASGAHERTDMAQNERRMWRLAEQRVSDLDEALDAAAVAGEAAFADGES